MEGGGESPWRGGGLLGGEGASLEGGGESPWRGGGPPWRGVSLEVGGESPWRGGGLLGGGSPSGGGIPACTEADPHPVNRITDACKNITLAPTSLRPVKIAFFLI